MNSQLLGCAAMAAALAVAVAPGAFAETTSPDRDRAAAERQVRERLGLPMMGAAASRQGVIASSVPNEGEIIGTLSYGYGAVWARPGLDLKERCYITLAVLTAKDQLDQLKTYIGACLKVGVPPEDVLEVMLQVGVYAGLSAASAGMETARRAFVSAGVATEGREVTVTPPLSPGERAAAYARVMRDLNIGRIGQGANAPALAPLKGGAWSVPSAGLSIEQQLSDMQGAFGYGEVWGRKRLGYRNRSFVTMAVLQALVENEQFHFHVNNALNLGIRPEEIHEAMAQAGVYAGLSGWQNATNVARDVFVQRANVRR